MSIDISRKAIEKKERDKEIVGEMIAIFCRKNHGSGVCSKESGYCSQGDGVCSKGSGVCSQGDGFCSHGSELCSQCEELRNYAWKRIDKCPFTLEGGFCANCSVHCYNPEMRKRIKEVMRFSGPRMVFRHPAMVISHGVDSIKNIFSKKERHKANG